MHKFWLSLALGAGLLACGTTDSPAVTSNPDDSTRPDGDDDLDEDETSPRGGMHDGGRRSSDGGRTSDGGRAPDAGVVSDRADASVATPTGSGREPNSGAAGGGATGEPPAGPDVTRDPAPDNGDPAPGGGGEPAPGDGAPSGGGLGGGCASASQCGDGLQCVTNVPGELGFTAMFPGGYCTKSCDDDGSCGGNGSCPLVALRRFAPEFSQCAVRCDADAECREGYVCAKVPALGNTPESAYKVCRPREPFGPGKPTIEELAEEFGPFLR